MPTIVKEAEHAPDVHSEAGLVRAWAKARVRVTVRATRVMVRVKVGVTRVRVKVKVSHRCECGEAN